MPGMLAVLVDGMVVILGRVLAVMGGVPGRHPGMAVYAVASGTVVLVRVGVLAPEMVRVAAVLVFHGAAS
ncbi:hypothetical protein [Arthrobacter sp. BPSS-3]|uniref:hypothetical protein n=1 Tax=Arthrobacter sp. BPSS-3 TaxID=3366580 RepID=UPI0037DD9C99